MPEVNPVLGKVGMGQLDADPVLRQMDTIMRLCVATGGVEKRDVLVRKFFSNTVGSLETFAALDALHPERPPRALMIFRDPIKNALSWANVQVGSAFAADRNAGARGSVATAILRHALTGGVNLMLSNYIEMINFVQSEEGQRRIESGQLVVIHFDDLVADPAGTLRRAYDMWGLPFSAAYAASIEQHQDERAAKQNEARKKAASGATGVTVSDGKLGAVVTLENAGVTRADMQAAFDEAGLDCEWIESLRRATSHRRLGT